MVPIFVELVHLDISKTTAVQLDLHNLLNGSMFAYKYNITLDIPTAFLRRDKITLCDFEISRDRYNFTSFFYKILLFLLINFSAVFESLFSEFMRSRCELICLGRMQVCLSRWSRNNKRHTRCIITLSPLSHFKGYPVHYTKWSDNGMQKEPAWPAESLQLEIEHAINYMGRIISYVRALFTFHVYCILQRFNYESFEKCFHV